MRVRTFVIFFAAFLILAGSGASWAQTVQGVITGTITDPSGAVVPGATVTITNAGTNASQSTTTGSDGSYRFGLVPPGTYTLDVKAANFAEVRASGLVVEASQTVPFSIKLELAKASAVIEVTSQAPLVQTATSDLATQIDRETILNAALPNRDVFSSLPFSAPSVQPGMNMNPTSGGARESGTAYLLNGGDDNDNFSEGAINIHPPLESVQDFSIKTNQMSAEYGRGIGAVVSANQVSGTNKIHGAVYEFNRNASLNANDFFYNRDYTDAITARKTDPSVTLLPPKPKYIRNQFGGEIDGPIKKDKTFFSFAYDRIKLLASTTASHTFVPTSAGLAYVLTNANGNGGGGSSIAQQILTAYPPVTSDQSCPGSVSSGTPRSDGSAVGTGAGTDYWGNGLPNPVGCLSFSDPQRDTEDAYYARIDHNFSAKDRLSFAANIYRQNFVDEFGGGPLTTKGPINGTTTNHFHNLTLSETHIFNPQLVNEVSLAHNRHFNLFVAGDGTNTIPSITVDNQSGGCLGFNFGGPFEGSQVQGFTQDRWGVTEGLTWTKGRHSVKFGGGSQYGILYRNWDLGIPGNYEFGELTKIEDGGGESTACSVGAIITPACDQTLLPNGTVANVFDETNANFAGDYPYFQETSVNPATGTKASAYRHYTYHDYYAFVQDDWKISARLTLNLGVRWDRFGAPSEAHGILAQFTNFGTCDILQASCIAGVRIGPAGRMWPTYNKDLAPRIGFAWDVMGNGKMAVRGGFGISYDRIFDNIWSNGAWNPPFYGLADFENDLGDAVSYSNPASLGLAYDPTIPGCQIPNAANANCAGHRVSVRTMDVHMKDSSGDNYYLGVERQVLGNLLLRVNYQGSFGRHLPMLENYNRVDGIGYRVASSTSQSITPIRPNAFYSGFNYRSNSVSSSYNSLVVEAQKRMGHGLQFQTSYTWSKLMDLNSDLFAGCSTIGGFSAPYYYISNKFPGLSHAPASYDHKHAYKFNVTYELPFLKNQKGFVGHALGGWTLGSLMQFYSGHPVDVYVGALGNGASTRFRAKDGNTTTPCSYNGKISSTGCYVLDQNGVPFNLGGDYNLDGVLNDHPVFLGSSISSAYSGGNPADGIFKDNNQIGCGEAGLPATIVNIGSCNNQFAGGTPNTLFGNPAYPSSGSGFMRFGTLGRNVFRGPRFSQLDLSLSKGFKLTERMKLDFRAQAQNLANHADYDCIQVNLVRSEFGKSQCLAQSVQGLGSPNSRIMSLGLRLAF